MGDVHILPAHVSIPGVGFLGVNAFVLKASQPVLIDTGIGLDTGAFMKALESVIDPRDLRWIWLTHDDADHTGSLERLMQAAPRARLAANSLAVLRTGTAWPVPMDRVHWLNPGDSISAGDRTLTAVRPPLFDNPTTIGAYDDKSGTLFSADCFGAIISAPAQDADDIAAADLAGGMMGWASLDSPWVHIARPAEVDASLNRIRQMAPRTILSAHLPPAQGKTAQFLDVLAALPGSAPAVPPNQAALVQILAQAKAQA
jgi:glyoxylase-like metal-dependent hydrolase (beta-lactamase superfamily II)